MKSVMGDLTDSTNRVDVVSMFPIIWSLGATSGYGSVLSYPTDLANVLRFAERF